MQSANKVYITNWKTLAQKYGQGGSEAIEAALMQSIKADAQRGLISIVVGLDVPEQYGGTQSRGVLPSDEMANKRAVDAIHRHFSPDYIVLVGGPDIIPHIKLRNPMRDHDAEPDVDSDIPYMSDARHARQITAFRAVTRVVGRIPDVKGARDPAALIDLLRQAREHRPQAQPIRTALAVSALAWRQSTEESIANLFNHPVPVVTSPTTDLRVEPDRLEGMVHFINCHGAAFSAAFYGDDGIGPNPTVLAAESLEGRVEAGAFIAAECCYGAALFDPADEDSGRLPMANAYLAAGAVAYVGSTSIAFGPASGNGAADLITQWFLKYALVGDSSGLAFL